MCKMREQQSNSYMASEIRSQVMYLKTDKKEQGLETKWKGTY